MSSSSLSRLYPVKDLPISNFKTLTMSSIQSRSRSRSLHEGPDTIDELLDRHVVKDTKKKRDEEDDDLSIRQRLTTTRREALSLYRDIIRASRFFTWPDSRGVTWRDVLRENARREFEEARFEKDHAIITRLLIGGRDAVQKALDKLAETHKKKMEGDQNRNR